MKKFKLYLFAYILFDLLIGGINGGLFKLTPALAAQQDVNPVSTSGPYVDLFRGWNWAGNGIGNVNNNYILTPISPDTGVCIYLYNNDSSSHLFTIGVYQSGDQKLKTFQTTQTKWTLLNGGGFRYTLPATSLQAIYTKSSGAAEIAVVLANGSGTGTADAYLVFTSSGGCSADAYPPIAALSSAESNSYNANQLYSSEACTTNPGAGAAIVVVSLSNPTSRGIFFRKARYSTSAAGEVDVQATAGAGTTCTNITNLNWGSGPGVPSGTTVNAQTACTTQPTTVSGGLISADQLSANSPAETDTSGLYTNISAGTVGLEIVTPAAITGKVCGTIQWYLK